MQKIKDNPNSKIYGLRYFNVYGSNEEHKGNQASPIHKFIIQGYENKEIQAFEGSNSFQRDFIHVDDVVRITMVSKNFS